MKIYIKNLFVLPTLIASLDLLPVSLVTAQTFTPLKSFLNGSDGIYDGSNPNSGLILSGNTLYGTTYYNNGITGMNNGAVFAVDIFGKNFRTPHIFSVESKSNLNYTNSDGANPSAGVILSGNTLYGTAQYGGSIGLGTVFSVNTDGTGFTNLHNFTFDGGSDGNLPTAGLILSGNKLYGTASGGGIYGQGTVFAVNTNGTGFTTMHSFTVESKSNLNYTNSDGANPNASLILSGITLYGTTPNGGIAGWGTLFAINTNSTGFTNLYSFTGGSDGANPFGLILVGNKLYGAAGSGGSSGKGTLFAINTNGTDFTTLYSFTGGSDGAYPNAVLILSGYTLYGTTAGGGSSGNGTVFAVNTDGTGFTNLYSFTATSGFNRMNGDGANPEGVILFANTLYGTAYYGGGVGAGTLFRLSLPPPQLTIIPSATNVILTWPTYAPGVTLQSTTNFVSSVGWNTNLPSPVIVNGQNAVTNPISGTQMFFRLSQ